MKGISLKLKLILLLSTMTLSMLSIYGFVALKDFEKDKITYVMDTGLSQTKSTASQIELEIDKYSDKVSFFLRGYSFTNGFHPYSKTNFKYEKNLIEIRSYQKNKDKIYTKFSVISNSLNPQKKYDEIDDDFIHLALKNNFTLKLIDENNNTWAIAIRFKNISSDDVAVVTAIFTSLPLTKSILSKKIYDTYLLNKNNLPLVKSDFHNFEIAETSFKKLINKFFKAMKSNFGISEVLLEDTSWIISSYKLKYGEMKVISLLPKKQALEAVYLLAFKSILFLLFLMSISIVIAILSSNKLTFALGKLTTAATEIAKGNFKIDLSSISNSGEVGTLKNSFNHMTTEIQRLLVETVEKARMEEELKTAQTVQANLFPKKNYESEHVNIQGFYEPASECSGDWWHYCKINNKFYLWIGDATGHGVPAALVTSAAKSVSAVLKEFPDTPIKKSIELFNKAINEVSNAKVMMTFFMGCFDEETGLFTYANASHDPPFLLSKKENDLKKKDIIPLLEVNGPRLGESYESIYEEKQIELKKNDQIVFYTDGVTELTNPNGDMLGERKFIKTLLSCYNQDFSLKDTMKSIDGQIQEFRDGAALSDDCTYFIFNYK